MNTQEFDNTSDAPDIDALGEASRANLTSALELARKTLPEKVILETLRDGLEEAHITVAETPEADERRKLIGSHTGRTLAAVLLDSKLTPSERRNRIIANRRAMRQKGTDQPG